jgi:hypothetical protein
LSNLNLFQIPKPAELADIPAFGEVSTRVVLFEENTSSDTMEGLSKRIRDEDSARLDFRALAGQSAEMLFGRSALLISNNNEDLFFKADMNDFKGLEGQRHDFFFDFSV